MKNKKSIIAVFVAIVVLVGGYQIYKSTSYNNKIEKSNEIMKEEKIKPTEKDKAIIEDVSKDTKVEYSYVTHHEDTVMLKIKFKKGLKDEERYKITGEYMDKLKAEYPDKNINLGIIPNEEK